MNLPPYSSFQSASYRCVGLSPEHLHSPSANQRSLEASLRPALASGDGLPPPVFECRFQFALPSFYFRQLSLARSSLVKGYWPGTVPAVLKLYVEKPFVQLIKHCHSTQQAKKKNRSIDCVCLHRIAFFFSLLDWLNGSVLLVAQKVFRQHTRNSAGIKNGGPGNGGFGNGGVELGVRVWSFIFILLPAARRAMAAAAGPHKVLYPS